MKTEKIKVVGYRGTWYVVNKSTIDLKDVYELEHEYYGDMAAHLIVDKELNVLLDDAWNGIDDYREHLRG